MLPSGEKDKKAEQTLTLGVVEQMQGDKPNLGNPTFSPNLEKRAAGFASASLITTTTFMLASKLVLEVRLTADTFRILCQIKPLDHPLSPVSAYKELAWLQSG